MDSLKAMFDAGEADRLALLGGMLEYSDARLARLDSLVEADRALGLLEDAVERPLGPSAPLPPVPEENPRKKRTP